MSLLAGVRWVVPVALLLLPAAATAINGPDPKLGARIFREGINARGEPIRALVGLPPSPLNGEPAACGACHALTGSPANAAPELQWAALVKSAAAKGGGQPYSEQAFGRAVNEGIAPSGDQLSNAMPRYSLSRSEIAALAAFLKASPAPRKSGTK